MGGVNDDVVMDVQGLTVKLLLGKNACKVVDNLSFRLCRGKTMALVGESGCGKSMTALALMRILPEPPALPPQGVVLYRGENLLELPPHKMRAIRGARIAMIFQDPMSALNPVYTVEDQLLEVVEQHLGLYGDEAEERIVKALEEVGIASPRERMKDYPHQLSGGMKQRVMIAMALLCEPDILIADEPTTALDVTVQAQVLGLMRDLQRSKGTAVLLITHDMGVVAEMADDVCVMYATEVMERGTVFDIFDGRRHPYTVGLFNSLPSVQKEKTLQAIGGTVPHITHLPHGCRFHPRCPRVMPCCKSGKVPVCSIRNGQHTTKCWLFVE